MKKQQEKKGTRKERLKRRKKFQRLRRFEKEEPFNIIRFKGLSKGILSDNEFKEFREDYLKKILEIIQRKDHCESCDNLKSWDVEVNPDLRCRFKIRGKCRFCNNWRRTVDDHTVANLKEKVSKLIETGYSS